MDRGVSLKVVKKLIGNSINNINTMFPAIVEDYNVETGKITITPKLKMLDNNGNYIDRAFLFECPTSFIKAHSFYVRVPYKKGDIVFVGCSQDALDNLLIDNLTNVSVLEGVQRFRLTDAIVIGGLMIDNENKMTSENKDDFIIQNRLNNDIIILKENGGVQIKTGTTFQVDAKNVIMNAESVQINTPTANVSGNFTGGQVNTSAGISLDNHTHSYQLPQHPAGSGNTSASQ